MTSHFMLLYLVSCGSAAVLGIRGYLRKYVLREKYDFSLHVTVSGVVWLCRCIRHQRLLTMTSHFMLLYLVSCGSAAVLGIRGYLRKYVLREKYDFSLHVTVSGVVWLCRCIRHQRLLTMTSHFMLLYLVSCGSAAVLGIRGYLRNLERVTSRVLREKYDFSLHVTVSDGIRVIIRTELSVNVLRDSNPLHVCVSDQPQFLSSLKMGNAGMLCSEESERKTNEWEPIRQFVGENRFLGLALLPVSCFNKTCTIMFPFRSIALGQYPANEESERKTNEWEPIRQFVGESQFPGLALLPVSCFNKTCTIMFPFRSSALGQYPAK
ncbi:hypothetical protein J6590_024590 [Homalodisca vitripennis]|nr:hypothetical protein J6590_024590 [Homalodisca vitripennis]